MTSYAQSQSNNNNNNNNHLLIKGAAYSISIYSMKTRGTPERPTRSSQRKRLAAIPLSGKKKKNKTPSAVKATKVLKKAPPKKGPPKPTKEQVDAAKKKTAE